MNTKLPAEQRMPFKVRAALTVSNFLAGTRLGDAFDTFAFSSPTTGAGLREHFNRYEAARRWDSSRTYLNGFVQDPRMDVGECDRLELIRKSRWFEKNDALANRLAEVFVEFTVGAYGPTMTPASSDDEWNQRVSDWITEWTPLADLTTRLGYANLMSTSAWRRFFDGEFFILKTSGDGGKPRLQGISAHRVSTPPELADREGKTMVEGVEIDSRGRPVAYWIQEGIDADKFTRRTANEVIHIFEPESPGQYRGIPMLAPVMNDLHDFADLFMFESAAAKVQSKDAIFVKNAAGELPSRAKLLRQKFSATSSTSTTNPDESRRRMEYYQKAFPGRTLAGFQNDEVQYLASNRPSVTTQWFFDYYASRICAGIGFSKLLVFPWSIQGTVARADLDLARNYFLSRFAAFQSATQQVFWFVVGVARFIDVRVADAPHNWTKVIIRPPRAVNVDIGRNSAATIAELDACLTTLEEQFAMRGLDYREQVRQRIREERFIDTECAKEGVSPARIRKAISEVLKADIAAAAERQEKEEALAE